MGRKNLILRPDGLLQQLLLDVKALGDKLLLADALPLDGMHGVQETDGKRGTRSHAAACGQVAIVMHLDAVRHLHELQHRPGRRVPDLLDGPASVDLRVDHPVPMLEEGREIAAAQIAVLVDGRGHHRTAVFAIPSGIIGAATKKRDPEWCSAKNHENNPWAAMYESGVPMSRNRPLARKTRSPRPTHNGKTSRSMETARSVGMRSMTSRRSR